MIVTDNNFGKGTKYDVMNAVKDIVEFQEHFEMFNRKSQKTLP